MATHRYRPRGAPAAIFADRSDEILMSGSAGTGKSRACLEKLAACATKYPGMRGLIVRKTLASLGSTALVTWRTHVIPEQLECRDVYYYGGSQEEPPQYRFRNGSRIMIGGMDKATRIMSSEYDMVYVQEAIEMVTEDWESIITRLRNGVMPYQQLLADTNPSSPTHWLKKRCDVGGTKMYTCRHEENPVLFDDNGELTPAGRSYMKKLDSLTGVRKQRLRYGRWVAAEGIIYEDFDPSVHIIEPFDIPPSWPRYWAVDFGFTNPFVCQMWAEDPDGRLCLYREIYRTRRTVDQHAADIVAARGEDPAPVAIICDHDAEGRAVLSRELGLPTRAANKKVLLGIERVQRRLRLAGDGRPRLMVMRNARVGPPDQELLDADKPTCTAEEWPGYIWHDGAKKEEPVKQGDHGLDCARYLVADRDPESRPGVRFL